MYHHQPKPFYWLFAAIDIKSCYGGEITPLLIIKFALWGFKDAKLGHGHNETLLYPHNSQLNAEKYPFALNQWANIMWHWMEKSTVIHFNLNSFYWEFNLAKYNFHVHLPSSL